MMRWDVINFFIKKYGYKKYLEIGVQDWYSNCAKIDCEYKYTVDPAPRNKCDFVGTSNDFFAANTEKFDLIFIDGLHHQEQVVVDINNSLNVLESNGIVLIHDCLPTKEVHQIVPDHGGEWTGDVWKAFVRFRTSNPQIFACTIDTDWGIGVIRPCKETAAVLTELPELNWNTFQEHRNRIMNTISTDQLHTI